MTATLEVQLHLERCGDCAEVAEGERSFRRRLRRELPREGPSQELGERLRRLVRRVDRRERAARSLRRLAWAALGSAAATALLVLVFGVGAGPDLVQDLVSSHRLYSRLEAPAELASESRLEAAGWVWRRLALSVPVPDFGQAGLRLIGARLSTHAEHPVVHLLYEKGRTLLSLYVLPASDLSVPRRGRTSLDGHAVVTREFDGHQVLLGRSGRFIFGLVSTLEREDLIECARTFLREGARDPVAASRAPGMRGERRLFLLKDDRSHRPPDSV